jgi:hypothetical protein
VDEDEGCGLNRLALALILISGNILYCTVCTWYCKHEQQCGKEANNGNTSLYSLLQIQHHNKLAILTITARYRLQPVLVYLRKGEGVASIA